MTCQIAISKGKFQGVIEPTTPIGLRCCSTNCLSLSSIILFETIDLSVFSKLSFEIGGNFSYLYGYNFKYNNASVFSKNGDFVAAINNRTTDLSLINSSTIPMKTIIFIDSLLSMHTPYNIQKFTADGAIIFI